MEVIKFPGSTGMVDPDKDIAAPEHASDAPDASDMRDILLRAFLQRRAKLRRAKRSPVSVLAKAARPAALPPGLDSSRINPIEMLIDWMGHSLAQPPGGAMRTMVRIETTHRAPAQPASPDAGRDRPEPHEKFWQIWMTHHDQLRRMALRLMRGNQADAEDALSAAMLRAQRAFDPDKIRNPAAWFNRLVRNACIDQHRHRSRTPTIGDGLETTVAEAVPAPVGGLSGSRNGEEELLSNEGFLDTFCAMLELPADLLEPLMLRCLAERSYDDIADHMGLSNAAVRKRVQLARRHLQNKI